METMRQELARFRAADRGPQRSEESAETRERLRSLGYLSSAVPPVTKRYTADDDPKRLGEHYVEEKDPDLDVLVAPAQHTSWPATWTARSRR